MAAKKAIKSDQSKLRQLKHRMSDEQVALYEADVALVDQEELPVTFHADWRHNVVQSADALAKELNDLKTTAEFYGLDPVVRHIRTVQEASSKAKALAQIPVANETELELGNVAKPASIVARSNLEIFIQLAEARLQAIEKKIVAKMKRKDADSQRPFLDELRRLRLDDEIPVWCRESESKFFRDLDAKFCDSMKRLRARDESQNPNTAEALDVIDREYNLRYGKLLNFLQ